MRRTIRHKRILGLSLSALIVACIPFGLSWMKSSKAQTTAGGVNVGLGDGSVRFISSSVSGLTFGQTLLFCFGIKGNAIQKRDASAKVTIEVLDAHGTFVVPVHDFMVPTVGFACKKLSYDEISADPEPTGRKQILVKPTLELRGIEISEVFDSFEIVGPIGETEVHTEVHPIWSLAIRVRD